MTAATERPGTLAEALAVLQTRLPRITKDAQGQYGKYADLADVSRELLPLLGSLGLSFTARPTLIGRGDGHADLVLAYALRHVSGDKDEGEYPLPSSGTPQQIGSAITYARRYTLCAVTGAVADVDDDGTAAEDAAREPGHYNPGRRHGKGQIGITGRQPDDPWASVDANGERQPAGDLPHPSPPVDRQLGALQAHFKRLGFEEHDRAERLAITATLAGSGEIESAKDLTQDQVQKVIRQLEKCKDRPALAERMIEIGKELNPA